MAHWHTLIGAIAFERTRHAGPRVRCAVIPAHMPARMYAHMSARMRMLARVRTHACTHTQLHGPCEPSGHNYIGHNYIVMALYSYGPR